MQTLVRALYEFKPSLPSELELVPGQLYVAFPDTSNQDGWIGASLVDRTFDDVLEWQAYVQQSDLQPEGVVPESYVEVVYDLSVKLKEALESASLHSDYSVRRSGVIPQSVHEQFVPLKKNMLQRYTPFVLTGAEKYVMTGCLPSGLGSMAVSGAVEHVNQQTQKSTVQEPIFITDGPQWLDEAKSMATVEFKQTVEVQQSGLILSGNFVTYCIGVGTLAIIQNYDNKLYGLQKPDQIDFLIFRRYSHFVKLQSYLKKSYPMLFVPSLPPKKLPQSEDYEFNQRQLEKRKVSLERWLRRILGHFVLRLDAAVEAFLYSDVCQDQEVLSQDKCQPYYSCPTLQEAFKKLPKQDPSEFYLRVFHPEFNLQPDLNKHATLYGSIRGASQFCTMSQSGQAIEDDITGDYASLKLQKQFLKETEDHLRMLMAVMAQYTHSMGNDAAVRLSNALEVLVDVGDDHVWCHQSNCQTCQNISAIVRRVGITLKDSAQETPQQAYQEVLEWLNEWTEVFLRDGEVVNPILQTHKQGVLIGKELDKRPQVSSRTSSMSQSPLYQPEPQDQVHLQPSHILARLSTLYNLNHAEVNHWTHRQRQIEFLAMMQKIAQSEYQRSQRQAELWQSCVEYIDQVSSGLVK